MRRAAAPPPDAGSRGLGALWWPPSACGVRVVLHRARGNCRRGEQQPPQLVLHATDVLSVLGVLTCLLRLALAMLAVLALPSDDVLLPWRPLRRGLSLLALGLHALGCFCAAQNSARFERAAALPAAMPFVPFEAVVEAELVAAFGHSWLRPASLFWLLAPPSLSAAHVGRTLGRVAQALARLPHVALQQRALLFGMAAVGADARAVDAALVHTQLPAPPRPPSTPQTHFTSSPRTHAPRACRAHRSARRPLDRAKSCRSCVLPRTRCRPWSTSSAVHSGGC